MATITMKELLEAGVHFGHQTKRWDPRMKEYIFGERNGIYIIDLQKTLKMFKEASKFVTEQQRVAAKKSLVVSEAAATFDVVTTVSGGGVAAQADAVKMGIARALLQFNAELRKTLKAEGLLTRDARVKERKKYGQKGARKRFQFSKR